MMHPSPTPRAEAIRAQGAEVLRPVVLTGLSVALLTQRAHWSVRGPDFAAFHALFGEVYKTLSAGVDRLAERVVTLGAEDALGGATAVSMPTLPNCDGLALARVLAVEVVAYAAVLDVAYGRCEEMRLVADCNALQSVVEDVEKLGWTLLSHGVVG